jgi:hypothetical protein
MRRHDGLLILAVGGILLATFLFLIALVLFPQWKKYTPGELAATRESVARSWADVAPASISSSADAALAQAARRMETAPYVAWVWVLDGVGTILSAQGGPAQAGDTLAQLDSNESDLIQAVDSSQLSEHARLELQIAVAIRREGEHNDVFRHMVRAVAGPDGSPVAYVAFAFDASPTLSAGVPPALQAGLLLIAAGFFLYWICLPAWAFLDARVRGEREALWGLFILLTNLAGFLAYLLVTRRKNS